jgi:Transposase, Mutator family
VLRQMVLFMAQRLMELDVEGRCGAAYDEKAPERLNSRNGYRDRIWETHTMMLEPHDEWSLYRRHMQLEGLQTLSDTVPVRLAAVSRSVPRISACPGCGTPCAGARPTPSPALRIDLVN